MKRKKEHNTVDVNIGPFLKNWIVGTYGTNCILLDKSSNLWMIIKQNLGLIPETYDPDEDRSGTISFELLTDGKDTVAYREPDKMHPNRHHYRVNMLYRCTLTSRGVNIICRYLNNQFKSAFHNYMKGALNNGDMEIAEAITEFLNDTRIEYDSKMIAALTKDWYRWRVKYKDEFMIPIFF